MRLDRYYGDQFEIEHNHKIKGQAGAIRVLGYRNREWMGKFDDAIAAYQADSGKNAAGCDAANRFNYGSTNSTAPDMCWARKTNVKVGIGINLEQHITDDLGVFFRGMISDGQSEVQAYTSTDRSISFGALSQGSPWKRPADIAGIGMGVGWISASHARYLQMGGVDGFIGDGYLNQGAETVYEAFYSLGVVNAVWLSADFQHIVNPAFNADRGPVNIYGARVHAEF
jgi:carbohydrate-selective porin OprB